MNLKKYVTKEEIFELITAVFIIVKKNAKILTRTKASTLITILGPLLLIFFAGIAFDNTNLYTVKIGTYSAAYNSLSNSFIEKLNEKQFKTKQYLTEEKCVDALKEGDIHACVTFSADFKLGQNNSNEITYYLDYSKLNLVGTITSVMSEQISLRTKELSANMTGELIRALDFAKGQIQKRKQAINSLTSQNDEASRHIYDIASRLEELDLQLDPAQIGASNLTSEKNRVQHWVENSVTLGESALQQSLQYIGAINDLIKASTASNDVKESVHKYLATTVNDIGALKERMATTKNILGQQSSEFDSSITTILQNIGFTKNKIDVAATTRQLTLDELNVIKTLLDKALINILELQKSMNEMEKAMDSIQVKDASSIVQPISTSIKPIVAEKTYLNYLFPTLIILVIMYTAMLLTPILVLLERNAPTYFRNFMTSTKEYVFVLSTFATSALILSIQLFVILFVSTILFSSQLLSSLFITIFICFLAIVFFTFVGMFIGYIFNTEEAAILFSTFLSTGFLFFSDAILPIESMSLWLGSIAKLNPFVVASSLLRKTIVLNTTISAFWPDLLLMLLYCLLAGTIAIWTYYELRQHNITKYLSTIAPTKQTMLAKINPKFIRLLTRK